MVVAMAASQHELVGITGGGVGGTVGIGVAQTLHCSRANVAQPSSHSTKQQKSSPKTLQTIVSHTGSAQPTRSRVLSSLMMLAEVEVQQERLTVGAGVGFGVGGRVVPGVGIWVGISVV